MMRERVRERGVVYRFFDDDDALLYIGCSRNLAGRLSLHEQKTSWFTDVARIALTHYADWSDAIRAEAAAIQAEQPIHNIRHKRSGVARPKAKLGRPSGHSIDVGLFGLLLLERGLSMSGVAALADIPLASLSSVVHGHNAASTPRAFAIAGALDVPPAKLFPTLGVAA